MVAGRREVLAELRPAKLLPSTDRVPERFELGTLPYELMAGTTAAVDFLADMTGTTGSRRDRLVTAMQILEHHEDGLRIGLAPYNDDADVDRLLDGLRAALAAPARGGWSGVPWVHGDRRRE